MKPVRALPPISGFENDDDVTELQRDLKGGVDNDDEIMRIINPSKVYISRLKGMFRRIVLDKAYRIRNYQTLTAESIRQLIPVLTNYEDSPVTIYLLTATSIINCASNFTGYLTIF